LLQEDVPPPGADTLSFGAQYCGEWMYNTTGVAISLMVQYQSA